MGIKEKAARGIFRAKKFVMKNGPTICTVVGCAGVVATGVLAWRGRAKCDDILSEYGDLDYVSTFEKVKVTAPAWGPVVAVGALSAGAIIFGNGLSRRQIAALSTTSAMNAAALTRTAKAVDDRAKEISSAIESRELDALPDNERRQGIFECDCDNFVICLNPDGDLYFDDWTGIWFRQLPSIVENAYFAINREFALRKAVSLHKLYELFGFEESDWAQNGIRHEFIDIGWEMYEGYDPSNDRTDYRRDEPKRPTGIEFLEFRERNGKYSRIFGMGNTISAWDKKDDHTTITYQYAPSNLYRSSFNDEELYHYDWDRTFMPKARFDSEFYDFD